MEPRECDDGLVLESEHPNEAQQYSQWAVHTYLALRVTGDVVYIHYRTLQELVRMGAWTGAQLDYRQFVEDEVWMKAYYVQLLNYPIEHGIMTIVRFAMDTLERLDVRLGGSLRGADGD